MKFILVALAFAMFLPDSSLAKPGMVTQFAYGSRSIFAWTGTSCPNGSAEINDPVYRSAGRLSGALYCIFPVREIAVGSGSDCPEGFERLSVDRCRDRRRRQ